MRLAGIGHRYRRGPWVLRDLDVDLAFGTVVGVSGANGTGKSTLLRIVAGVQRPGRGHVAGRPHRVAYVPERLEPPPVRVQRWSSDLGRVRGTPTGAIAAALAALGTPASPAAPLSSLSKGTVRKVLLAEALAAPATLLVLDEPWADLDADGAAALSGALCRRAAEGALVVVADHTGAGRTVADTEIGTGGSAPRPVVDVRYRGDGDRVVELDEAAARLGFRRVGP